MPELSGAMRKRRMGTAKNFTLLLLLYLTQPNNLGIKEALNSLGVETIGYGKPLTELLQTGKPLITI